MSSTKGELKEEQIFNEFSISRNLSTEVIGKPVIFKEKTISTQIDAHKLAKEGAEHGTIVIANEQTGARGRLNRPWHSVRNKAISMSLILRPNIPAHLAPKLTLFTATVLSKALSNLTKEQIQIKWPNDLLINGKKFVGILTEMHVQKSSVDYLVIGMGINVNYTNNDLPMATKYPTTSLFIETGNQWNLSTCIQAVLKQFEVDFPLFLKEGFSAFKSEWEQNAYKLGEQLYINDFKRKWYGRFKGITEDGALSVENEFGKIESIYSAEIEWYS